MNQHTGSAIYKITNPLQNIPKSDRPKGCYVYIHRRATDGVPFYVGKGIGPRAWRLYNRSKHHHNCSIKNGVTVEIYKDGLTSDEACKLEKDVIENIGFDNLVNISTGGESGAIGITPHNIKAVECSNGMRFESATSAAKWCQKNGRPKAGGTDITACCRGRIKSAHGYDWRYEGDDKQLNYIERGKRIGISHSKPVVRSDGLEFSSSAEAGRYLKEAGLSITDKAFTGVAKACRDGSKAYGFYWEYKKTP